MTDEHCMRSMLIKPLASATQSGATVLTPLKSTAAINGNTTPADFVISRWCINTQRSRLASIQPEGIISASTVV